jgi:hypothetical protein
LLCNWEALIRLQRESIRATTATGGTTDSEVLAVWRAAGIRVENVFKQAMYEGSKGKSLEEFSVNYAGDDNC